MSEEVGEVEKQEIKTYTVDWVKVLPALGLAGSRSQALRLIHQGALSVDGTRIDHRYTTEWEPSLQVRVGRKMKMLRWEVDGPWPYGPVVRG